MAWFNCATHRQIGANVGGALPQNIGLILHHAVANGSLFNFFNNPAAGVSAHFWVAKDGRIEQYVDTDRIAWHAMQLNTRYIGVETEGCVEPPYAEPMTDEMLNSLITLYNEGVQRHGWARQLANADGQAGLGYHRMAVATGCPCDVRLAMRPQIIGGDATAPPVIPPTSEAPAWPGRYLTLTDPMMFGGDVQTWQEQMANRGWTLSVDGWYGPQSQTVCVQFQSEKGLAVDGIVGPMTWNAAWTAPIT